MIKAIVTDIEGTTTSLSFVKDVLFPYARAELPNFVRLNQTDPEIQQLIVESCQFAAIKQDTEAAIVKLIEWIDQDKKITPLKALQGLIWQAGYQKGDFKGHLYPDVIVNIQAWNAKGVALYVYSSGSVLAQKLLFGHTEAGNLIPYFSGFFDTNIGGKKEADSYRKIAVAMSISANSILFLSDIKEELDAARSVGFNTLWLTRDKQPDANAEHCQVSTFDAINIENMT